MLLNRNGKEESFSFILIGIRFDSRWNKVKLARSSRKNRVQQRKTAYLKQVRGADAE